MDDRALHQLIVFFEKFNIFKVGTWFLDRDSLLEYVVNCRLIDKPQVGIIECTNKNFENLCINFRNEFKKVEESKLMSVYKIRMNHGTKVEVRLYKMFDKKLICASDQTIYDIQKKRDMTMSRWGTWKFPVSELKWYNPSIPYKFGTILDIEMPNWIHKIKHVKEEVSSIDTFFTEKRIKNALELMKLLRGCAKIAGMEKYLFLGFGTLLGIAREGGFIRTDKDMDHCVQSEFVTPEQEEIFLQEIARTRTINGKVYVKGLYEGRCRRPLRRRDSKRFMWTSCGHKKVKSEKGVKSCIWNWFKHGGYDWHSKGRRWVNLHKFPGYQFDRSEDAIAKGIPTGFLNEFTEIKFKGITVNIPKRIGSVLDVWYPGWARPKKGASVKKHVMIIPSWKNKNSWKMV
jgi:phosphorylcholine metabolism protein LicD